MDLQGSSTDEMSAEDESTEAACFCGTDSQEECSGCNICNHPSHKEETSEQSPAGSFLASRPALDKDILNGASTYQNADTTNPSEPQEHFDFSEYFETAPLLGDRDDFVHSARRHSSETNLNRSRFSDPILVPPPFHIQNRGFFSLPNTPTTATRHRRYHSEFTPRIPGPLSQGPRGYEYRPVLMRPQTYESLRDDFHVRVPKSVACLPMWKLRVYLERCGVFGRERQNDTLTMVPDLQGQEGDSYESPAVDETKVRKFVKLKRVLKGLVGRGRVRDGN